MECKQLQCATHPSCHIIDLHPFRNTKRAKRNVDSTARVLSAGASALPRPALDMNPNEERRTKREVHTGGGMRQMGSHNDR